jgi:hypothetical protein
MHETRAHVPLCAFQASGKEIGRWLSVKTRVFLVAVNTQLDAAPLNFRALGKLTNKVNKVDQLNMEIEKSPAASRRFTAGFLTPMHTP